MPNQKVCAACGASLLDTNLADDLDVCAACLGLHDQLPAPTPDPEPPASEPAALPVARRVVEGPPAPAAKPPRLPVAPPPLQNEIRWRKVADGYRDLRDTMLTLLLAVPLSMGARFVETYMSASRRGSVGDPPQIMSIGSLVFLVLALFALVRFINGAVALVKKPNGESGKGLPRMVTFSAFIPGANLIVFPLLLSPYTRAVGIEIGKRSVVRSAWILLGCTLVLIPPVVLTLPFVLAWAVGSVLGDPPTRPTSSNSEPVAAEVLFGVGAGGILWLGAYVVTIMLLSGVSRAIEKRLRENTTPADSSAFAEQLKDTLRPDESRDEPA